MRTRLSACRRKQRFDSAEAARMAAVQSGLSLHAYRCDHGDHYHLTSRTKGRRIPRPPEPAEA